MTFKRITSLSSSSFFKSAPHHLDAHHLLLIENDAIWIRSLLLPISAHLVLSCCRGPYIYDPSCYGAAFIWLNRITSPFATDWAFTIGSVNLCLRLVPRQSDLGGNDILLLNASPLGFAIYWWRDTPTVGLVFVLTGIGLLLGVFLAIRTLWLSARWLTLRGEMIGWLWNIMLVVWCRQLLLILLEVNLLLQALDWSDISTVATACAISIPPSEALACSSNHLVTHILTVILIGAHAWLRLCVVRSDVLNCDVL